MVAASSTPANKRQLVGTARTCPCVTCWTKGTLCGKTHSLANMRALPAQLVEMGSFTCIPPPAHEQLLQRHREKSRSWRLQQSQNRPHESCHLLKRGWQLLQLATPPVHPAGHKWKLVVPTPHVVNVDIASVCGPCLPQIWTTWAINDPEPQTERRRYSLKP